MSTTQPDSAKTIPTEDGDASSPAGLLKGLRLLLVDDSEEIVSSLATLCEMEGAKVSTACNGQQAWAQLKTADFDILVSDLGMPVMDGYTLLALLRHGTRNADIPAIALTGHDYSLKAVLVGFTDQICKPVRMQDLIGRIAELATPSR